MPLHPQAQAFLESVAAANPPGWDELGPVEGRQVFSQFTQLFGNGPSLDRVMDVALADGVAARVYHPDTSKTLPVVMYFHGGGWVLGSVATHDSLCRRLCQLSGCAVVSVDYRLAPEHPFPAALDDCFAASVHIANQGSEWNLDGDRIAVCGDSAGGNLAAAVALKARDERALNLDSQWLLYPVIEPRFDSSSYRAFQDGFGLTRHIMRWFWDQYAQDASNLGDPYAVPSAAKDLRGLPYTHILTAEYDVLRDEAEAFASQLKEAGVSVSCQRFEGALHGFIHFAEAFDDGHKALADIAQAIRQRFGLG